MVSSYRILYPLCSWHVSIFRQKREKQRGTDVSRRFIVYKFQFYSSPIFANLAAWSAVISKCLYFVGCTHMPLSSDFPIKAIHKHHFLKYSKKNEVLQQSATILHFLLFNCDFYSNLIPISSLELTMC